jgi:hypothetical protein
MKAREKRIKSQKQQKNRGVLNKNKEKTKKTDEKWGIFIKISIFTRKI